ncbi:MAG: serine/threonine protein kinase [Planctomycetales bacterium]|nr:serine/threonine protein kinase [Planctomycetales bacterium]
MSSHDGTPMSGQLVSKPQSLPVLVDESNMPLGATAIGQFPGDEMDSSVSVAFPAQFRLGRFELIEKVGEGGFGVVYRARDTLLQREVALKVPRRERLRSEKTVSAFLNEARAVAKLHHPGIVAIYDVGQSEDGSYFIAMEFVKGQPLSSLIRDRKLSFVETATLVAKIADAVHEAHKQGLIHRDLKPANVLVDDDLEPHVADFGIAVSEDQQREMAGDIAGTVPYMSPEQVVGEVHLMDGRTDIWSLGVIVYQLLTGRRPFTGNNTDLIQEILRRDPKPLRQINDRIPKQLEDICLKALQKRPSQRYATMMDLAVDLRSWLQDQPGTTDTGSRAVTLPSPAIEPVPAPAPFRRRTRIAVLVGCLLLLIVALSMTPLVSALGLTPLFNRDQSPKKQPPIEMELGAWHPLMLEAPTPLYWSSTDLALKRNFNAKRHEFWIDSPSTTLWEIGETDADHFLLQVMLNKSSWTHGAGHCGIAWGYQASQDAQGRPGWLFNAIVIHIPQTRTREAPVVIRAYRKVLMTADGEDCPGWLLQDELAAGQLAKPDIGGATLELEIKSDRLVRVLWNRQVVDDLGGEASSLSKSLPSAKGKIVLWNGGGSTTFSEPRIQLLSKNKKGRP